MKHSTLWVKMKKEFLWEFTMDSMFPFFYFFSLLSWEYYYVTCVCFGISQVWRRYPRFWKCAQTKQGYSMCSCESRSYLHEPLWELSQVRQVEKKIDKLYFSKLWLALNFFYVLINMKMFFSLHSEPSRNLLQALRWTLHMWGHMSAEGKHITRYMMWVHNYCSKCVQTFKKNYDLWTLQLRFIFMLFF